MDVIFVLGSTGKEAVELFEREKNTTKSKIDQQSFPNTKYGLLVYGAEAKTMLPLDNTFDKTSVKSSVDRLTWSSEGIRLDRALTKAYEMFTDGSRPESRRQLIVFVTVLNETITEQVKYEDDKLRDIGVAVIYVVMGDNIDNISIPPSKKVIEDDGTKSPEKIAKEVSKNSDKSNICLFVVNLTYFSFPPSLLITLVISRFLIPLSHYLLIPLSAYLLIPLSPYLLIPLSPYLLIPLSPYLLIPLSPYLLIHLSPYFPIPLSPYLLIPLSPYLLILLYPYLLIPLSLYLLIPLSLYPFIPLSSYPFIPLSPFRLLPLSPYISIPYPFIFSPFPLP